ncbi:MAG: hypothetical protein MJE12_31135 [Alphaproteobacteria bacterium]|nr:hypothetical protein [Alphaproteobacteria bacterium]
MHKRRHRRFLVHTLWLGLILAGCAGLQAQWPIVKFAPPADAVIKFDDPLLDGAKVVRVHDLEALEFVEYARFETNTVMMEAVYDIALNDSIVLEYDWTMKRMIDTWNANKGQSKTWGEQSSAQAWHGSVQYLPYRLSPAGLECAGFSSAWNYQPQDPFGRPGKVFFGYICGKPGTALRPPTVAKLLQSVKISQRDGGSFEPVAPRQSINQAAFDAAKGSAATALGNAKFPFNFGRVYTEGEGRRTP